MAKNSPIFAYFYASFLGVSVPLQCWFAFQCAALFRATVLAPLLGHPLRGLALGGYHEKWPIRASLQPLGVYLYAFGLQSCATRLIFAGSAPLAAAKQAALGTSGRVRRGARGLGLTPAPCAAAPAVFAAIRAAMLRRRIRLLALRRVSLRIRRTASLHVAQFGTRPLVPSSPFAMARFSS